MNKYTAYVTDVTPNSLAARCGLRVGDILLSINGLVLRDIIDVQVYSGEPELSLGYVRDGAERTCTKKRRYGEPLGLDFSGALFDAQTRVCQNNCDFCFVTQLPSGFRPPLYIKDDDYRLSFLHGNYVTLTNLQEADWERIDEQFLSPLFISVHVTDPEVRVSLLHNPRAANIMDHLSRLQRMGIKMYTQAVLVPGRNDGELLDRTISDLAGLYPAVEGLSVVPVGLTRWHNPIIRPYTEAEAVQVLEQLMKWRDRFRHQLGVSFVYPADEWFLKTGVMPPEMASYDDQLPLLAENGVGMVRRFMDSYTGLKAELTGIGVKSQTWVTGTLFAQVLSRYAERFTDDTGIAVNVVPVTNHVFGQTVTVAGLLTVIDITNALRSAALQNAALQNAALGDVIVLPDEIFRGPDAQSLDGQTALKLAGEFERPITLVSYENTGWRVRSVT